MSGDIEKAREILATLLDTSRQTIISPFGIAIVYTALNDKDKAFEWLNKAYEDRAPHLAHIRVDPTWDNLRSDPRYINLLKRMNLEP